MSVSRFTLPNHFVARTVVVVVVVVVIVVVVVVVVFVFINLEARETFAEGNNRFA